MTNEKVPAWCR